MVINNSNSSFKSFHSALSTPVTSTFEDTLVDSLTPFNLAEHLKNTDLKELQDARMMQYIEGQRLLIEEQKMIEKEISQEKLKQQMRNAIWGIRKTTANRVGYHGNHLGYHYYYVSPSNNDDNCNNIEIKHSKLKRMFGRITVPFRSVYNSSNKKDTKQVRWNMYDDKNKIKHNSDSNCDASKLIAIGYDEWV